MSSRECASSEGKTVRRYAAEVLGESLATGVPNIVKTPNWKRKAFKFSALALCIFGFLYQTIEFLSFVFTFPSIIDIYVYTPSKFLLPSITICNNNGIKRSEFCEKYPGKCEAPSLNKTEFCEYYPHYCGKFTEWETFTLPMTEFHNYETKVSFKELIDLGHRQFTLFMITAYISDELDDIDKTGPLIFFKSETVSFLCYSIHSRALSSLDAVNLDFSPLGNIDFLKLEIDFEPYETFMPDRKPGGFIAIHSPYEMVNPFDFGHHLAPAKSYKIHLQIEEEELLPFPYKSDCVNYTQIWLDNGRTGPRSQEMCKQQCAYDLGMQKCGCSFKVVNYPYDESTCFTDSENCFPTLEEIIDCTSNCKDDCHKYRFKYSVQEREVENIEWNSEEDKEEQKSYISFYASDPEVVVYKYRAQYQHIEVFSYIGGYVGIWLGISLVAVLDFIECLFLVACFACKKRKVTKKEKETADSGFNNP